MAIWNLGSIRQKVRNLSGRLSLSDLPNNLVDEYINHYVQYEFPSEVKLNKLYKEVKIITEYHVAEYDFPSGYTNFVPEAKIDYQVLSFSQEPDLFEDAYPLNVSAQEPWTGDGTTTAFATTLGDSYVPLRKGSVVVSDNVEYGEDDGEGLLISSISGTSSGTINYSTGAISYTFQTAPISSQAIRVSFVRNPTGKPIACLMFDSKFTLYPVPDKSYRLLLKAWSLSSVIDTSGETKEYFTEASDRPRLDEWGVLFALGAARRIASDYGEIDRYNELSMLLREQVGYVNTRTLIDLESARALPQF
jgi:hypothetical protein